MARANLSALLNKEEESTDDAPISVAEPVRPAAAQADEKHKAPERPVAMKPAALAGAPFLRLARKETRLREDQYQALTQNARRLTRAKTPGRERITENTLIRVAIDLLLSQADKLSGSDEAELRKSVGL
jgi:hypothetical protein